MASIAHMILPPPPSWYPGHMRRFTRMLPELLSKADFVLEIRDSRLPLTSINGAFESALRKWRFDRLKVTEYFPNTTSTTVSSEIHSGPTTCEHVIVMNKCDLVPVWGTEIFRDAMNAKYPHRKIVFASTARHKDVKKIHDMIVNVARQEIHQYSGLNVLVVGMPNVGKSTLLNALRNLGIQGPTPKAFRTSADPGMTRSIGTRVKLCEDPLVYSLDSPGVMLPFLGHGQYGAEKGIKLALIAGLKNGLYSDETLTTYLLDRLNFFHPIKPAYLSILPPGSQPTSDTSEFLETLAARLNMIKKGGLRDHHRAAAWFVQWWREEGSLLSASDPPSDLPLIAASMPLVRSDSPTPFGLTGGWGFDFQWNVWSDTFDGLTVKQVVQREMSRTIEKHMEMLESEINEEQPSKTQLIKRELDKMKEKSREKQRQMARIKRRLEGFSKGIFPRKRTSLPNLRLKK